MVFDIAQISPPLLQIVDMLHQMFFIRTETQRFDKVVLDAAVDLVFILHTTAHLLDAFFFQTYKVHMLPSSLSYWPHLMYPGFADLD